VKELGVAIFNCPCLGEDLSKLFDIYWEMGAPNKPLPASWSDSMATAFNAEHPMELRLGSEQSAVFFSVCFRVTYESRGHRPRPQNFVPLGGKTTLMQS
jgi:hypothetical protein